MLDYLHASGQTWNECVGGEDAGGCGYHDPDFFDIGGAVGESLGAILKPAFSIASSAAWAKSSASRDAM